MSNPSKSIAVGAGDAAFELKAKIVEHLKSKGIALSLFSVASFGVS